MSRFAPLLKIAKTKRKPLLKTSNALRLVNGIADEFPGLTLDQFNSHFQLQFFTAELLPYKEELIRSIVEIWNPLYLVSKYRLDPDGKKLESPLIVTEIGESLSSSTEVQEGQARFVVDLKDTINPGLFLDMRDIRIEIGSRSTSKTLLNLFSYTCSFAVHARLGGATKVTNVDISSKILEKGRANYQLNGLTCLPGEFFKGSSFEYLEYANKKGLRFDGIVLDPPSFARNKNGVFNVREHLQECVALGANLLNPKGFFMVSSNYSGFTPESVAEASLTTIQRKVGKARLVWAKSQGPDFPGHGSMKESCLSAALIERL
jgi:23S rRNA (cytosine1962-C5)-methyltransferase